MANLNEMLGIENETVKQIGAEIGFLADLSGAVEVFGAVIGFVENLAGNVDDTTEKLNEILKALNQGFDELGAHLRAEDVLDRQRDLDLVVKDARGVFAVLKSDVQADPPLSPETRRAKIETCITALVTLGQEDKWNAVKVDQAYFDEPFTGLMSPPADANGLAFNHLYILPLYLQFALILLGVGEAFNPTSFAREFSDNLRNFADILESKHNKIVNEGIVPIRRPVASDLFAEGVDTSQDPPRQILTEGGWGSSGRHYGAVDIFSGFSSIGVYPPLDIPGEPVPQEYFTRFFAKLEIRIQQKIKEVYTGIGLSQVHAAINRLRVLAGNISPSQNFADWSVREVIVGLGFPNNPLFGPTMGVLELARFLSDSSPTQDIRATSLRQLLSG
jgi:hypothetical protein